MQAHAPKPCCALQRTWRRHLHTQHRSCAMTAHRVTPSNWDRVKQERICRIKRCQMHTNGHFWSCCAWGPAPTLGLPGNGGHRPRLVANPAQQHLDLSRCLDVPLAWMTRVRQGWGLLHAWPPHDSAYPPSGTSPWSRLRFSCLRVVTAQRPNGCRHLWADP